EKALVGVDLFLDWDEPGRNPEQLAERLQGIMADGLKLTMITNRGTKVWPQGHSATFRTDHWRCRFVPRDDQPMTAAQIGNAMLRLAYAGLDVVKSENLYTFDGVKGYSLGQGE
ncbi:MAG: NADP-dependent isocitrate dehydrogenase, partial [Gemmatimonadota bacterium]|nr:NADP-dependent isocitrate dehydrogenase [Gemmatimonadota bacterium]